MSANITEYVDTVVHAFAHAATGTIIGKLVDNTFPAFFGYKGQEVKTFDGIGRLSAEMAIQFAVGFFAMSEAMQLLTPNNEYYRPSIGDGTAIFFYFYSQKHWLRKFEYIISYAENSIGKEIRNLLHTQPDAQASGTGGGTSSTNSSGGMRNVNHNQYNN